MHAGDFFHRLQFHNYTVLNNEIRSKTLVEPEPVEHNGNRLLAFYLQTPFLEFTREDGFVDRFQQSWTERRVDMKGRVDDRA